MQNLDHPPSSNRGGGWSVTTVLLAGTLGLAWANEVHALDSGATSELEAIKAEALEVSTRATLTLQHLQWPDGGAFNLYLASQVSGESITAVAGVVDGVQFERERFGPLEQRAFDSGGWYRLVQADGNSAHRVHVEVMLRAGTQAVEAPPRRLDADINVGAGDAISDIVAIVEAASLSAPKLRLVALRSGDEAGLAARLLSRLPLLHGANRTYVPGGPDDPEVRGARFLSSIQDYLGAATTLRRRATDEAGSVGSHFALPLSQALLAYGLPQQASQLLARMPARADAALDLRRDIAECFYRRGEYQLALSAAGEQPPQRKPAQLLAWQDVESRILLAQGRMGEAAAVLGAAEPQADYAGYVRYYNLGIALIADGNVSQGLTILERVGGIGSDSALMVALSDRANLTAGSYFLREGQGATAIPFLERVHDPGIAANAALLALGWAWLAPPGTEQAHTMMGDERMVGPPPEADPSRLDRKRDRNLYQRFDLGPFDHTAPETSEDGRLKRALTAWAKLADRPGTDEAIPEALLASAAKLDDAGAEAEATVFYQRAIALLEQTLVQLAQAEQYVSSALADNEVYAPDPDMGFDRELHRLPPEPIASYLAATMAGWPFREQLADYRDSLAIDASLEGLLWDVQAGQARWCPLARDDVGAAACDDLTRSVATIGGLQVRLADASAALHGELRQILLQPIRERTRSCRRLLGESRFSLARLYDRHMSQ